MLAQEIVNALVQLAAVLAISAIAWLALGRRRESYTAWLGLTAPDKGWLGPSLVLAGVAIALTVPLFLFGPLADLATGEATVGGSFEGRGLSAETVATVLVVAIVKTGLTEEIFFRGLIGKQLVGRFGFAIGNTLQAIPFGAIHLLMFAVPGAPEAAPVSVTLVFLIPAIAGWLMGWANYRYGGGSIVPGWTMHALGNTVANLLFLA